MTLFGPRVWEFLIFGSTFWILDVSSWLYIQFFTRNPNLQSEFTNSFALRRNLRKNNLRESRFLIVRFLIICLHRIQKLSNMKEFRHDIRAGWFLTTLPKLSRPIRTLKSVAKLYLAAVTRPKKSNYNKNNFFYRVRFFLKNLVQTQKLRPGT